MSDTWSGGERYLLDLLGELRDRGWKVTVASARGTVVGDRAAHHGLRVHEASLGPKLGRRTALRTLATFARQRRAFRRVVDAANSDVVLLQYKLEQILSATETMGSVLVFLEHGPIPKAVTAPGPLRWMYKRGLAKADVVFAASEPARASLHTLGASKICSLPAGIHGAPAKVLQRRSTASQRTLRVLFAGRLEKNKGLVGAIDLVLRSPGFSMVIAGTGGLENEVARLTSLYPDKLSYVGHSDHVHELIASSDFGLYLTSDPGEGRPLFAMECLAQGKPVVAASNSPAMAALAKECSPGIVLLSEAQIQTGELQAEWATPIQPMAFSWAHAADRFEQEVAPFLTGRIDEGSK